MSHIKRENIVAGVAVAGDESIADHEGLAPAPVARSLLSSLQPCQPAPCEPATQGVHPEGGGFIPHHSQPTLSGEIRIIFLFCETVLINRLQSSSFATHGPVYPKLLDQLPIEPGSRCFGSVSAFLSTQNLIPLSYCFAPPFQPIFA